MTQPNLTAEDLAAVDTMTKYPSIPTYHPRDPETGLLAETDPVIFPDGVIATEKIDGTNVRLIFWPGGGYLIGSRERLLYASGDLVGNPELGIVPALTPIADHIAGRLWNILAPLVVFLELYGGKVGGAAPQYRGKDTDRFGWRLFDVARITRWPDLIEQTPAQIAPGRDAGQVQEFSTETELARLAGDFGMPLVPRLFSGHGADLPTTIRGVLEMLNAWNQTQVALPGATPGLSEGIVLRGTDRSVIAKARQADYARALRKAVQR